MTLKNIPTNIITGFLGVGKSTAILHLLKSKPEQERWAVLVNEFGEVGIDGSLLKGNAEENQGIFIKEVPGGCMCCAAGLPMQMALNMLLAKSKPDRLLIEPTGLGHPKEVLSTLKNESNREVLAIQKTITLVDARKITDDRYLNHEVFLQQLDIADVIVANKSDLYSERDFLSLKTYLDNRYPDKNKLINQVTNGEISIDLLSGDTMAKPGHFHNHADDTLKQLPLPGEPDFPKEGYLSVKNKGEGFYSQGWIFKPDLTFDSNKLYDLLISTSADRLKAVFITANGVIAYNKADDVLTEVPLEECSDSRIELITQDEALLEGFEEKILQCID